MIRRQKVSQLCFRDKPQRGLDHCRICFAKKQFLISHRPDLYAGEIKKLIGLDDCRHHPVAERLVRFSKVTAAGIAGIHDRKHKCGMTPEPALHVVNPVKLISAAREGSCQKLLFTPVWLAMQSADRHGSMAQVNTLYLSVLPDAGRPLKGKEKRSSFRVRPRKTFLPQLIKELLCLFCFQIVADQDKELCIDSRKCGKQGNLLLPLHRRNNQIKMIFWRSCNCIQMVCAGLLLKNVMYDKTILIQNLLLFVARNKCDIIPAFFKRVNQK